MRCFIKFLLLMLSINAYSQFNYQSLIRDTNGNIVVNTDIQIRFGIIYDSPTATPIYSEIHQITTPSDGVINILIGDGVVQTGSSSFTSIDWSKIVYVKQEVEIDNSGSFIDFGTNKLNSVPIAEFAKKTTISTDDLSNLVLGGTNLSNSVNTSGNDGRNNYVFSDNGMQSNTTGDRNIAIGNGVLVNNTIGRYNVAIGNDALQQNVSEDGNVAIGLKAIMSANKRNNTAIGFYSMVNINSDANTAVGSEALKGSTTVSNNTGIANTAVGYLSMFSNSSGDNNNAFGNVTLEDNTTGRANSAFGSESLRENIDGNYNAGFGNGTLWKNTSGSNNTAVGYQSSSSNTTGVGNTSMGQGSLFSNSIGSNNVVLGQNAGYNLNTSANVIIGNHAGYSTTVGHENTVIGANAFQNNSSGSKNTLVGGGVGSNIDGGNYNTIFGHQSGLNIITGESNTIIGAGSDIISTNSLTTPQQISNSTAIGANAIVTTSNTIQLGDNNVTLVNTSGVVSATSFRGNANELSIMSSNTVSSLLSIIEDLQSKISDLTTNLESATTKTYFGRAFQTNIVTQTSIFTVSYNEVYEQPNWLEYTVRNVTANVTRSGDFYGVSGIYTSHEDDYHDNVWDKGHLAPAASYLDSQENLEATFSYLNCVLMKDNLNRYEWAQLEDQVRTWASVLGVDIDVRVDVFFDDGHEVLETGAHVPSRFLKSITLPAGYTFPNETISKKCFEFPNANTNGANWTDFEVSCSSN